MYRQYTDIVNVTEYTPIYGTKYWQHNFPVHCTVIYVKIYNIISGIVTQKKQNQIIVKSLSIIL